MKQRGYILIYVMAVLLFLVGAITGGAYALRMGARETGQQLERLRAEYRLRGALEYALAQFALGAGKPASDAAATAQQPGQESAGWRLEDASHALRIDGIKVEVAIEDPGGIADANSLDERMWTDYFDSLGIAQPGQARQWAAAILDWKNRVGRADGRRGFGDIDDMLMLDALPAEVRYGSRAAGAENDEVPGLADLFMVGTGERVFDANRAALPLLGAETGARPDQLAALSAARRRERLSVGDAVRILGVQARPLLREHRTDPVYRLRLSTRAGSDVARLNLNAFVQRRNGQVRLLASRIAAGSEQDE